MSRLILVAVDIRSTHNVGAFFRNADGFGSDIILVGLTARPIGDHMDDRLPHIQTKAHKAIAKTALGSEDNVKWKYFKDFASAKDYLKSKDVSIYAVEQSEFSKPINELKSKNKSIALVVGPEVDGLPDSIIDQCDGIYEIPMVGKKESFNVSVASGIALYQASL